jgi:hypothetical protein
LGVLVGVAVLFGYHVHPATHAAALDDLPDFRLECGIDHYAPDDPIVFPGQPGVSHMHSFYSNPTTNAFTTTDSLMAAGGTCAYLDGLDHSAYWIPSLMYTNPDGTVSRYSSTQQQLVVYYRKVGGVNGPTVHPFPIGLRMVAGDSHATAPQNNPHVGFDCSDGGPEYQYLPDCTNAQSGNTPVGFVSFPNCWDGVHLDSADHKSHMAYPVSDTTGQCPADHPVSLPRVDFEDWLNGTSGGPNYFLSSNSNIYSMHGDVYEAWDPRLQNGLIDTCMNTTQHNCSATQVWTTDCCGNHVGDVTAGTEVGNIKLFGINDPKYAASPTPSVSATPTPTGSPVTGKPGDVNGDGSVNVFDLSILLSAWNTTASSPADLDKNGVVNVFDLSILLSHWGT